MTPNPTRTDPAGPGPRAFDFRRPGVFSREHLAALDALHETFARSSAELLAPVLRTEIAWSPMGTESLTFDGYLRSLPSPSLAVVVAVPPLPGPVIVAMRASAALTMVDRMLGGSGVPGPERRPTDLEMHLIADLVATVARSLVETFAPLIQISPSVAGIEANPPALQILSPAEPVALLSFASPDDAATMSLCYPHATLAPLMDRLAGRGAPTGRDDAAAPASSGVEHLIGDAPVRVALRLRPTAVRAGDVAALRLGDVLRLDHRIDEPAVGIVEGIVMFDAALGRRGRRLAVRFDTWR